MCCISRSVQRLCRPRHLIESPLPAHVGSKFSMSKQITLSGRPVSAHLPQAHIPSKPRTDSSIMHFMATRRKIQAAGAECSSIIFAVYTIPPAAATSSNSIARSWNDFRMIAESRFCRKILEKTVLEVCCNQSAVSARLQTPRFAHCVFE